MSDPMMLPSLVRAKLGHVERPESVNFTNPPSRVIDRAYRHAIGRTYKKTRDGVKLFHRLDPELAYQRCPHLKLLLDEMLDLAKPR